jgi:enterochelin esterase-like enzyme
MKRSLMRMTGIILFTITGCSAAPAAAPQSSTSPTSNLPSPVVQKITVNSPSLQKHLEVDVYLPPYYNPQQKYPVLYVFHGKDGNADSWMDGAQGQDSVRVDHAASQLIASGKIRPLIIVSPELDNSYGVNTSTVTTSVNGYSRGLYEDSFIKDVVPYIDEHFSTIASREGRFVGGLSMGGFAALHDALLHPDMFSKVGVMSAALWVGGPPDVLGWIYPTEAAKAERDPITLAQRGKVSRDLSVCILEGSSDPFFYADRFLYKALHHAGVNVTYREYAGGHNYEFWGQHASELLLFFDSTAGT